MRMRIIANHLKTRLDYKINAGSSELPNSAENKLPREFEVVANQLDKKLAQSQEQESLEHKINVLDDQNTKLKTSLGYTKVVNELGQKVTSSLNLDEVFYHLYSTINSMMDAAIFELGIYFQLENKWKIMSCEAGVVNKTDLPPSYHNHMAEWSLSNHKEIILDDAETNFARYVFEPLKASNGKMVQSILCFPMYVSDRDIGVITVISFRKNAFESYHAEMIRSLLPYTTVAIENALVYQELKTTQAQLIHNEKMAFLGELTAGIAHEIQNPLNFVTNFSDVSLELIDEIYHTPEPHEQKEILDTLHQNLSKVVQHSKRADGIVKGMLLHSRAGSGLKQLSDVNKIVEEFLNLSLHGMRAKDNEFNCHIELDLDHTLPGISLFPQDLGRVLINLYNNAFYAMNEKKNKLKTNSTAGDSDKHQPYEPKLTLITSLRKNNISIQVKDNGPGIKKDILGRIFQPFFTTKPTGEGTGLGLSLSYDIIKKGHAGELTVESEYGNWTEFRILLPLNG
ncbi:MAG: ATP-binding protein [Bacteroidia bacterium]